MLNIGSRLLTAAKLVRGGNKIADIGTDHAYLPAYLVMNGIAEDVLACDIGVLPLENAANTVKNFNLQDKIELRISDGLKNVKPCEVEEITICGMGGTLMSEILEAASWIKHIGMHLVLQPMTHSEDVRYWLCENGFEIEKEIFTEESGHLYVCISAEFTGEKKTYDDGYYYFGYASEKSKIADAFYERQYNSLCKKINGLKLSDENSDKVEYYQKIVDYYNSRIKNEDS